MKHHILSAALIAAIVFTGLPTIASAGIYYMSPTGSDSNSGSISSPWRTVSASSGKLQAGDILYARGGTYTGQTGQKWNSPSGTASAPITWKAYPGEKPVFDGQNANSNFLTITGKDWLIIDGMTIQNYKGCCAGIWIGYSGSGTNYAENNIIRNSTFLNIGGDFYDHAVYISYGNKNITVNNNIMKNVPGGGIHAWHGPGVQGGKFFNNLVTDCGPDGTGIVAGDGSSNLEIYNNTVVNCKYAIALYGGQGESGQSGTRDVVLRNNIFANSRVQTAYIRNATNHTYSHNLIWGTSPIGTNAVTADPQFVSGSDYHLKSTSPAINKGTSVPVSTDLDGKVRPQGATWDIGAYEYGGTTPPPRTTGPPPPPLPNSTSIEAGGTASYTDTSGKVWQADQYFTGGATPDRGAIAIVNTVDDRIYQTERWGMSGYAIPLANGTYTVKLHFAETSSVTTAGQRVFNVSLEGATVLSNFDIYAAAGRNTALIKSFSITVSDGVLNIGFTAVTASPEINGIEITR